MAIAPERRACHSRGGAALIAAEDGKEVGAHVPERASEHGKGTTKNGKAVTNAHLGTGSPRMHELHPGQKHLKPGNGKGPQEILLLQILYMRFAFRAVAELVRPRERTCSTRLKPSSGNMDPFERESKNTWLLWPPKVGNHESKRQTRASICRAPSILS